MFLWTFGRKRSSLHSFCQNYTHQRDNLFRNISQIIGADFSDFTPAFKLSLLMRGDSLDSEDGRETAHQFQLFLLNSHRFTTN